MVKLQLLALVSLAIFFQACYQIDADLLISDAEIYDGSGDKPFVSSIAVKDGKIIRIHKNLQCNTCTVIDAKELVVSPGFIDLHAHLESLPIIPDAESALRMGVTTALGGPDGSSPLNIGRHLDELDSLRSGINVGYLIGHNTIRLEILHMDDRPPSAIELQKMKGLAEKGMRDGAFGISTGLKYLPGAFAETDEIVEISKVVAEMGGFYTSHLREEGLGLIEGVQEAIDICQLADIPVVLTHHKAIGLPMWGKSKETLKMVDQARSQGLDIMIDQYPYTASFTSLSVLIPPWAREGGQKSFVERCEDPSTRNRIKEEIIYNIENDRGGGDLKRIQIASFNYKPEFEGKTLYDWAVAEKMAPNAENGAELVIEAQLNGGGKAIYHAMSEEDVERIMKHPFTMIASDGRVTKFQDGHPHPRVYGTFPRVLGHYSRDLDYFPLEEAIRKMTALPAQRMGLSDRGLLKEGNIADLVIFDKNKIIDKATFEQPHQFPSGIRHVIVNGQMAIHENVLAKERFGKVLRGPAHKSENGPKSKHSKKSKNSSS